MIYCPSVPPGVLHLDAARRTHMTTTNVCSAVLIFAIAAWAVTRARAEPAAGDVPAQLSKLDGLLQWRCIDGQV